MKSKAMIARFSHLRVLLASLRLPARAWRGATWGVAAAATLLWATISAYGFGPAGPLPFVLGLLGGLLAATLVGGLVILAGALLRRVPPRFGWAVLAALPLILLTYMALPLAFGMLAAAVGILLVSAGLGAGIAALIGWRRLGRPQRGMALAVTALGLLGLLGGVAFLLADGFPVNPPVNAAALSANNVTPLALPDPSQRGPYPVRTLAYGSGTDARRPEYAAQAALRTAAVDGSALLKGWSGLRRAYWGFGPEALPLNGRVWYPDAAGAFPLILIVHGNHPMEDPSEGGYAYLAELLASRGFIVAALDQNFLNLSLAADLIFLAPLKGENDARAWLILEHLRQWQTWAATPGNPFFNKVNLEAIGLIGHSRGGEAVAIAAAFNRLPCHPDDAAIRFDYGFHIRGIAAIAPVDGQFQPGGRRLPLADVNYLVLHGAHDMDVVSFSGARQYARLAFNDGQPWFKAALYIYGANHGQFNRAWGRRDMLGPARQLFNLRTLMPPADQEQIAKVAISAFMEAALRDRAGYRGLFRDPRTAAAWLPDTIYLSQYAAAETRRAATYEEDVDLTTATLPGATLRGQNLTLWREQVVPLKWENLAASAVYLGWDSAAQAGTARYTLALAAGAVATRPESALVFSLADAGEAPRPDVKPASRVEPAPLDLTVEVVDRSGRAARLPLSHFALLQPQLRGRIAKVDAFSMLPLSEPVFQTFEFALADFAAANPQFDPTALAEAALIFDRTPSGVVILDEIGLRP